MAGCKHLSSEGTRIFYLHVLQISLPFEHCVFCECCVTVAVVTSCTRNSTETVLDLRPRNVSVKIPVQEVAVTLTKRQYEQRVREVEHATFTPLVMSTTGGMGRAATTFYRRLASMISEKMNTSYSQTVNWIRCKLSFALLRASIMSIRGARSSRHHAAHETAQGPIDLLSAK